jgi:hypothetical protein
VRILFGIIISVYITSDAIREGGAGAPPSVLKGGDFVQKLAGLFPPSKIAMKIVGT